MTPPCKIYSSPEDLAVHLAEELKRLSNSLTTYEDKISIALSGGSTPKILFQLLAQPLYRDKIKWKKLHLFWGDERCVPPDHPESNYGMTRENLLQHIEIPESNIHRIRGEITPDAAAKAYSKVIRENVPPERDEIPRFDWVLLGVGEDGHTASLFPGSEVLRIKDKICAVAIHPVSGQKRITLTLPVINHAKKVTFLVAGESKRKVVSEILHQSEGFNKYPAAQVNPVQGELIWLLDKAACKIS